MPVITRWYVKTSLVYLVAALALAVLLTLAQVVPLPALLTGAGPVYVHLFLVGWVTQLIMGIVFWMFPKYSRERPRGHEGVAVATYVLLNVGLVLRALGEPALIASARAAVGASALWQWTLVVSAGSQWLAGILFVANTWARVKER